MLVVETVVLLEERERERVQLAGHARPEHRRLLEVLPEVRGLVGVVVLRPEIFLRVAQDRGVRAGVDELRLREIGVPPLGPTVHLDGAPGAEDAVVLLGGRGGPHLDGALVRRRDGLDGALVVGLRDALRRGNEHVRAVRGHAHEVLAPVHHVPEVRELALGRVQRLQHAVVRREDDEGEQHDADDHVQQRAAPPARLHLHG